MKFTLALATIVGLSNAVKLEAKQYGWAAEESDWLAQSKTQDDDEWYNDDWLGDDYYGDYYGEEWHGDYYGEQMNGEDWHGDDYYCPH